MFAATSSVAPDTANAVRQIPTNLIQVCCSKLAICNDLEKWRLLEQVVCVVWDQKQHLWNGEKFLAATQHEVVAAARGVRPSGEHVRGSGVTRTSLKQEVSTQGYILVPALHSTRQRTLRRNKIANTAALKANTEHAVP